MYVVTALQVHVCDSPVRSKKQSLLNILAAFGSYSLLFSLFQWLWVSRREDVIEMWYLCVSTPHLLPLILCTLLSYGTHHLLQREASLIIDALIYGCKGKNSGNCLILRFLSTVKVYFIKLHFISRNLRLLKSLFIRKLFIKPMKQNNLVDN